MLDLGLSLERDGNTPVSGVFIDISLQDVGLSMLHQGLRQETSLPVISACIVHPYCCAYCVTFRETGAAPVSGKAYCILTLYGAQVLDARTNDILA